MSSSSSVFLRSLGLAWRRRLHYRGRSSDASAGLEGHLPVSMPATLVLADTASLSRRAAFPSISSAWRISRFRSGSSWLADDFRACLACANSVSACLRRSSLDISDLQQASCPRIGSTTPDRRRQVVPRRVHTGSAERMPKVRRASATMAAASSAGSISITCLARPGRPFAGR